MKTLRNIIGLSLAGLILAAAGLQAQNLPANPSTATAAVTAVANTIIAAAPSDREELIEAAIAANPESAAALVDALIRALPAEAPTLTAYVVQSVLALPSIDTAAKSTILTQVASNAEAAALQIPPTAVPDIVATVNAVKDALANVPETFTPAVQNYITPITAPPATPDSTQLPATQPPANNDNPPLNNDPLPTQTIVSDDTP